MFAWKSTGTCCGHESRRPRRHSAFGGGVPFFVSSACYFSLARAGGRRHGNGPFIVRAARPPVGGCSGAPCSTACSVQSTARSGSHRPTLYDPEEFAALYHADKDRAIALLAAMSEPQKVRQALAYAAWLAYHGIEIDLATVLAAWEEV